MIAVLLLPVAGWLLAAARRALERRFPEGRLKRILFTRID